MMHHEQESRRMRAAGFVRVRVGAVSGWVPELYAALIRFQIGLREPEVAEILAQPSRPRGWQKGKPRKEK